MKKGTVKWFNNAKGYGFILGEDGNEYFVHYSSIECDGFKTLEEDATVVFEATQTERGYEAKKVSAA